MGFQEQVRDNHTAARSWLLFYDNIRVGGHRYSPYGCVTAGAMELLSVPVALDRHLSEVWVAPLRLTEILFGSLKSE